MKQDKLKVGVIGATGMVGQRFLTLLEHHPYFEVTVLAASASSAGKTYAEAVDGRWKMAEPLPEVYKSMRVYDADADFDTITKAVDFVFCAVNMKKDEIKALEERYAKAETPVVSNNSANRWTDDVPMGIPEINDAHLAVIEAQRRRLGTRHGFIAVKPNCSIQSYVGMLTPLLKYGITEVIATTYQAISGAGKTFADHIVIRVVVRAVQRDYVCVSAEACALSRNVVCGDEVQLFTLELFNGVVFYVMGFRRKAHDLLI